VLLSRSLKLTLRNKAALMLLLLQAPMLGGLIGVAIGDGTTFQAPMYGCMDSDGAVDSCEGVDDKLACDPSTRMAALQAAQMTPDDQIQTRIPDPRTGLIAILMALFLPMIIASSNVLVGERTIYERERLAGLNILPYVLSRFAVLAILGTIVAVLHLAVAVPLLGLQGGFEKYLYVGVLTTWCASAIGLSLSAAVQKPVSALWGINLLVIPQLLFAGSIVKLEGPTWAISWLTATRYGLEALTNVDLRNRAELSVCQIQRYMENLPGFHSTMSIGQGLLFATVGLGGMTLFCFVLTMLLLKLKDKS